MKFNIPFNILQTTDQTGITIRRAFAAPHHVRVAEK
jgi:hypothetical protein